MGESGGEWGGVGRSGERVGGRESGERVGRAGRVGRECSHYRDRVHAVHHTFTGVGTGAARSLSTQLNDPYTPSFM